MGTEKRIYFFEEGSKDMKDLLGGKGANLAEMTRLGLPVPPGFTITTKVCKEYLESGSLPKGLEEEIREAMAELEKRIGRKFGDAEKPLLVSVRSGAPISMPGMMDTVLNLGLNDESVEGLAQESGNPTFAYDSYRRFIQMFSDVVQGLDLHEFEKILKQVKKEEGVQYDKDLSADALKRLVDEYKKLYEKLKREPFLQDPWEQLFATVEAVFRSWNNERAIEYRKHEGIPDDLGTAVNVQVMVFGNLGENSATGVAFTRNPSSGEKMLYGEFLPQAQGEDVVAGIRTPLPVDELKKLMPDAHAKLVRTAELLEKHYRDMQDIEFTIMDGKFYILQTRSGKRTGVAAVKIAHDMVQEGLITKEEAIMRLTARDIENCLFPTILWIDEKKARYYGIDPEKLEQYLAEGKSISEIIQLERPTSTIAPLMGTGLAAGPGAATGIAVFESKKAAEMARNQNLPIILIRPETSPDDFPGMAASQGILTLRGGATSHAAIVSRQIGKTCIVGASDKSGLKIKKKDGTYLLQSAGGKYEVKEGDWITLDGYNGRVFPLRLPIVRRTELPSELNTILEWADSFAKLYVRANADKPSDTELALRFGAKGIGLARTEHQFFETERQPIMKKMIMARTTEERKKYLDKLLKFQIEDFKGLFKVLKEYPAIIRLIDPPLHEFLPREIELLEKIYKENLGPESEEYQVLQRVRELQEANPMLGLRGVRLGLLYPEIIEMQVRAIIIAAIEVQKEERFKVKPEIMIPLVISAEEFREARKIVDETARQIFQETGDTVEYKVGTMIEVPRAALVAGKIAAGEEGAEFFSFGTNDLHQMTLGFSRDDVGKFLPLYLDKKLLPVDPFVGIDEEGVGRLMKICVKEGRAARSDISIGICGEAGGNPQAIDFCHRIGLDYVSASPYRVPVARLAAAQARLRHSG